MDIGYRTRIEVDLKDTDKRKKKEAASMDIIYRTRIERYTIQLNEHQIDNIGVTTDGYRISNENRVRRVLVSYT